MRLAVPIVRINGLNNDSKASALAEMLGECDGSNFVGARQESG